MAGQPLTLLVVALKGNKADRWDGGEIELYDGGGEEYGVCCHSAVMRGVLDTDCLLRYEEVVLYGDSWGGGLREGIFISWCYLVGISSYFLQLCYSIAFLVTSYIFLNNFSRR
jgi:hypothetical protein